MSAVTRAVGSFMGVPHAREVGGAKAVILGIPFDCGLHPVRLGARMGPAAIREQSHLVRPYQPPLWDLNPLEELGVVDMGDVDVVLGDIVETYTRIEEAVDGIVAAGATPITFGGDGAVTLPQLRALGRRYPDLALLHFDAHTDTYPDEDAVPGSNERRFNPATTFARAAEEGIVDLDRSLHIGARGTISMSGVFEFTRAKGFELITGQDMLGMGIEALLAHLRERVAGRPVYLCWGHGFLRSLLRAPACTPPTWGGGLGPRGPRHPPGAGGPRHRRHRT